MGEMDEKILTRQSNPNNPTEKASGRKLALRHILALEIKRFHHSKRNKKGFICEVQLSNILNIIKTFLILDNFAGILRLSSDGFHSHNAFIGGRARTGNNTLDVSWEGESLCLRSDQIELISDPITGRAYHCFLC